MADTQFLSPNSFLPKSTYSLLPFLFERWADGRVYIANAVGESVVLESPTFFDFVNKRLEVGSTLYFDLQSKHFLFDDTSSAYFEALASKYLTKKSFLNGFTKLHIFVTTLRCDQSCPYCQVSRQGEAADSRKYDMDLVTLEKSIRMMLASPASHVTMEFQGGEPLVRFDLLQEAVARTNRLNQSVGKKIDFVLCSNLTLLDDRHLYWCKECGVTISTSLDGPAALHNRNRPFASGMPTHAVVEQNIRRAQEALGRGAVSALMTTTRASLKYPEAIVDEYLRLDLGSVFVRELNPYGFAIKSAPALSYSTGEFFDFYRRVLERIIQVNREGRTFPEAFATLVLTKALTPWPIGFVDLQSPAGAGTSVCVYNYDGDVFVSDEARMLAESGDPMLKLGNLLEDDYDRLFFGETMQGIAAAACNESLAGCSDCAYQALCGADPVRNYRTQRDLFGVRPSIDSFCKRNKALIEYVFRLYHDADPDLRRIFWAWITQEDVNNLRLLA